MATETKHLTKSSPVRLSEAEADYLMQHKLARLATCSLQGEPHVVPISYSFDGSYLYFTSFNLKHTLKLKQIQQNNRVAMVVDDWDSESPWSPTGIEIRGVADIMDCQGATCVRITPEKAWSWGL